jgi:HAD superfamily hydrolase (TIGR01509 family)
MTAPSPRREAALLFDLDGTLADTREANYRSYRDSLAESGRDCPRAHFDRHFGGHWRDFLSVFAATADPGALARLHRRKQELYPLHLGAVRLNHRLVAILHAARGRQRTGLVTTASRANVELLLGHFDLGDRFDAIVTGDDVARAKPAPDGYLRCLQALQASAAASTAYEDSAVGIAAARAAGLRVVVVDDFAPVAVAG